MSIPAAILAGGLATRLRPLTEKIPKVLLDINGEPFLAHQLRLLKSGGIHNVVICAGYLGEMIQDYAGDGRAFGLGITYSLDGPKLLGTAGALKRALPLLGDRFFVIYGDSYLPCDYQAARKSFEQSGKLGLMTVYRNEGRYDTSNVEFEQSRILRYDKKNKTPAMRYIDYGLGIFQRSAFDQVPDGEVYDLAKLYQELLAQGQLHGLEIPERFYEIGSAEGLEELRRHLQEQKP